MGAKILNLAKLERKIRALPVRAKVEITKAMASSADEITDLMRNLVPVNDGALKKSIGWGWGPDVPKGAMKLATVAGRGLAKDFTITIWAGDNEAFYARWVEFGTAAHAVDAGGGTVAGKAGFARGEGDHHPGAKAQPFFYVSYRARRKSVKSKIARGVSKAAKIVAQNGG